MKEFASKGNNRLFDFPIRATSESGLMIWEKM
jgi:hypothetical protein